MAKEPKVLTGLLERRALESAFDELNRTSDPDLRLERAQAIAERGEPALNALLALLDTPDPGLRGKLGLVATLFPREMIVPALQAVANASERSDQARVAAASLLDRYLGEPTDSAGFAPLADPDAAALQSLRELVFAMDQEPLALLDFLEQLGQQPAEVADMLVDAALSAPDSPHIVTFLRVLAQAEDASLARRALDQLGRLRTPEAVAALLVLSRVLSSGPAAVAERAARKLRFSGVQYDALAADGPFTRTGRDWRVLLSPVDPDGTQFVWFIGERQNGQAAFVTLLLNDPQGILSAAAAFDMPAERTPRRQPVGSLLNIDSGGGVAPALILLEAPYEEGLAAVQRALERHWESGVVPPVSFRVLSPLLIGAEAAGSPDEPTADLTPVPIGELIDSALGAAWFDRERAQLASGTPADRVFTTDVRASYVRRLRSMARWLKMAGEVQGAAHAEGLAQHLLAVDPRESPFIQQLAAPAASPAE